ncbi:hypothetical protein GGX14DRAFT_406309 [Mycena pura]|uniref:Uncharacterized protein n=1 Tax=Mycena pura TaxID=153505 RepID=A0AAD6Y3E4_9AGAR|nr:hypothetical protein GGX14DRAFT_406309 [Mycena pura]
MAANSLPRQRRRAVKTMGRLFDGDQTTLVSSHLTTASTPFKFACHVPILKPYPLAAQRLAQLLEQDVQSWAAAMILTSHTWHWDPPAFRIFAWLHPYDAIMINSITPAITGVHTHFPHLFFGPASPQCHKNIGDVRADTMDRRDGSPIEMAHYQPLLRAMSRHSDGYEWLPDPCTWLLPATRPVHGATTRYHKGDLPTGLPRVFRQPDTMRKNVNRSREKRPQALKPMYSVGNIMPINCFITLDEGSSCVACTVMLKMPSP